VGEGPTAALLPQIFEVDPLACPTCRGPVRIIACITQALVIDQILSHRRICAATATRCGEPGRPIEHAGHLGKRNAAAANCSKSRSTYHPRRKEAAGI